MGKIKNFAEFLQSCTKNDLIWALLDAFREGHISKRSSIVIQYICDHGLQLESSNKNFPMEELMHEFDSMAVIQHESGETRQIALPSSAFGFEFAIRDFMSPKEKIIATVPHKPQLPTSYLSIRKPLSFLNSSSKPTPPRLPPEPEKPLSELDKAMMGQVAEPVQQVYGGDHPSHWGGGKRGNHNSNRGVVNMSAEEYNEYFGGNNLYGGG